MARLVNQKNIMDKKLIEELKNKLEQGRQALKKELESFATEDKNVKGNWDAKRINAEDTDMEEKADEVEEYDNKLSLEHSLELRLKSIDSALEKTTQGGYGVCEKCKKEIGEERLMVCPEARLCMDCNK